MLNNNYVINWAKSMAFSEYMNLYAYIVYSKFVFLILYPTGIFQSMHEQSTCTGHVFYSSKLSIVVVCNSNTICTLLYQRIQLFP